MSLMGRSQPIPALRAMSAIPLIATAKQTSLDVGEVPLGEIIRPAYPREAPSSPEFRGQSPWQFLD
jgi:hypothetical protein